MPSRISPRSAPRVAPRPSTVGRPAARPNSVNTRLPASGPGFRTYNREAGGADQYGTRSTIDRIQRLGQTWAQRNPNRPFEVGDISRQGGGRFPPHSTHRSGNDVDMRPISRNGGPSDWRNP